MQVAGYRLQPAFDVFGVGSMQIKSHDLNKCSKNLIKLIRFVINVKAVDLCK